MTYDAHIKPRNLLLLMADRRGEKITARDAVALRLAAETLQCQADLNTKQFGIYADILSENVQLKAELNSVREQMTAALEITT